MISELIPKRSMSSCSTCPASRLLLGTLFGVAGFTHLVEPEIYLAMMPSYLPAHDLLILLSGIFEILLGGMLLFRRTHREARLGLVLLLIAVFPANLEMALHPERFPALSETLLWLRLPLQLVLIWWVILATRSDAPTCPAPH